MMKKGVHDNVYQSLSIANSDYKIILKVDFNQMIVSSEKYDHKSILKYLPQGRLAIDSGGSRLIKDAY